MATPVSFSRRALLRGLGLGAAAAAGGAFLAACGAASAPATTAPAAATTAPTVAGGARSPATGGGVVATTAPRAAATAGAAGTSTAGGVATATRVAVEGLVPGGSPDITDAYTKFPTVYKTNIPVPARGGQFSTFQILYNPPPAPREQNRFWQELEKRLGARWEPTFAPAPSFNEKFAAILAGGDLPDIVNLGNVVNPNAALQAINQGAFTDLTPYLDGDKLKDYPNLAAIAPRAWRNSRVKGKIYRVPSPIQYVVGALVMRKDWAEKVGYAQIKNSDDFLKAFTAFSKGDPDGNGSPDTFGIGSNVPGDLSISVSIYPMFRVPQEWRQSADGSFTRYIETDEFRQAIEFARKCFEAGIYHPDATTMDIQKAKDLFQGGKIGGFFDNISNARGEIRRQLRLVNPNAESTAFVPPGHDGGKGSIHANPGFAFSHAIPAKAGRDPERVKELLRIMNFMASPIGSEEWMLTTYGVEGVHYTLQNGAPVTNTDAWNKDRGDFSGLCRPPVAYVDSPQYAGDAVVLQELQRQTVPLGVDDPSWGLFSATNAARTAQLTQFDADRRVAIITGREPLSALNGWISEWKSRGGDQIRQEYQQAAKERG
jgi:putative aldouronate transport system substrate-binding protein